MCGTRPRHIGLRAGDLLGRPQLARGGDSAFRRRATPASRRSARPATIRARTPGPTRPTAHSTTSGATSGRPPSSGGPASPTGSAGRRTEARRHQLHQLLQSLERSHHHREVGEPAVVTPGHHVDAVHGEPVEVGAELEHGRVVGVPLADVLSVGPSTTTAAERYAVVMALPS